MQGVAASPITALNQVAEYYKVLSELSRLVLCILKSGPMNVSEIMTAPGRDYSASNLKG